MDRLGVISRQIRFRAFGSAELNEKGSKLSPLSSRRRPQSRPVDRFLSVFRSLPAKGSP